MMCSKNRVFCFIATLFFVTGCAPTHTGGPIVDSGAVIIESRDVRAAVVFNDSDRRYIRDYYRSGHKNKKFPPGLAKKQELPPGLRKHIEEYGQLPPGIEGRMLPDDLERNLQRLPAGFVRLQVGGDVLLMNEKSRVVVDAVWDVN